MPEPVGEWRLLRDGTDGGTAFGVFRTATTSLGDDYVCTAVEVRPAPIVDWGLPGGSYLGKDAPCAPWASLSYESDPLSVMHGLQDREAKFNFAVGTAAAEITAIEARLRVGGTRRVVPVDRVWTLFYDAGDSLESLRPIGDDRIDAVCRIEVEGGFPAAACEGRW